MLVKRDFQKDANQREVDLSLLEGFACGVHFIDLHEAVGDRIAWHWHPHMEVNYMLRGEIEFDVDQHHYHLRQGEALFINANALHSLQAVSRHTPAVALTLKFHPEFLAGNADSVIDVKYVQPITTNKGFSSYHIRPDSRSGVHMLSHLLDAIQVCDDKELGYEFQMHHYVSSLWMEMLQATESIRKETEDTVTDDTFRDMLHFIQTNYGDKITLADIAEAGMISTRECSRIFQKYVHIPPIDYLNLFRIRSAAKQLLRTDLSITEIGENCGFSSTSYFGKMFEKEFGMRPREYRKTNKQIEPD